MHGTRVTSYIRNAVTLSALAIALSGCLMGDEKAKSDEEVATDNQMSGSVGDGPIVGAKVKIKRNNGELLAETISDDSAGFELTIREKGKFYPLSIEATGGTDLVTNTTPDFDMTGAALKPGKKTTANINPFSTIAFEIARELPGGVSAKNLELGESHVLSALSSGLTTLLVDGPMRTKIDGANIAEIVKSSESLGEIIRRTRDLHQMFGRPTSGNQVLREISSDLTDGVLDGRGSSRTEPRTSAITSIVAVMVYMEAMQDELHVNDQDATAAMDASITRASGSTATAMSSDLHVTDPMILAVRTGLSAYLEVENDAKVMELSSAFDGVQSGMDAVLIQTLVPADYRQTLETATQTIAGADDGTIDTFNSVIRVGIDEPSINQAPSISGTPTTSIVVGSNYSFVPSAADPEGNSLTFSISNRPTWLNFNSGTGALSGTPSSSDIGSHNNIVIGVSDGEFTANLPTFSINVASDNLAPSISGSPASQVDVGTAYSFTPNASDPDGNTLTFSILSKPSWASFSSTTGRLSGSPSGVDVGTHGGIIISVSDGVLSASLPSFAITVNQVAPTNSAPTISGNPSTQVTADSSYSFTPNASDADGDSLTFSVSGLPVWASFNSSNGRISGTPSAANVGTFSNIRINVSDGNLSASLANFSITVDAISLGSVTLNWTPPTQNEDGSALTDLAGYRFYWGTTPGSYPNSVTINNPGLSSYVVENLAPGSYDFVATSINSSDVESVYSNPATKVVQ